MRATKTRWMLENFLVVRRNSSPCTNPALAWLVCQGFGPSLVWGRLGLGVSHSGFPSWQGTGGPAAPTSVCSFQLLLPFPCTVFRQKGHVCFATYSPIAETLRSSSLGLRENSRFGFCVPHCVGIGFPDLSMSPKKVERVGTVGEQGDSDITR